MHLISPIICNCLIANSCFSSIFFTNEESKAIKRSTFKNRNVKDKQYILSCIIFNNTDDWIVWINGKKYTKLGVYDDFSIEKVDKNRVTIKLGNGKQNILTVHPSSSVTQQENDEEADTSKKEKK